MSEKSKLQRAIEYIYNNPGCRTYTLALVLDCRPKDVPAYLKDPLACCLIISCKVSNPDGNWQYEYKPGISAPAICPDFREWRKDHFPLVVKPLHFSASGPRDLLRERASPQPAVGKNTGSHESGSPVGEATPSPEVVADVETQGAASAVKTVGDPPANGCPAASIATKYMEMSINDHGELTIAHGAVELLIKPDELKQLETFMRRTHPLWCHA